MDSSIEHKDGEYESKDKTRKIDPGPASAIRSFRKRRWENKGEEMVEKNVPELNRDADTKLESLSGDEQDGFF